MHQFTVPPRVHEDSFFSTFSPTLVISCLFDNSYSNRCEVISHRGFNLHFSDDEWCWASFHVPVGHLYVFFGKMSIHILYFFNQIFWCFLLLSCMSCLYIFDINPLSDIWFANIFSHSVSCLFNWVFKMEFEFCQIFIKNHDFSPYFF